MRIAPDSNWGPTAYKAVALPTELCRRESILRLGLDSSAAGRESRRLQRGQATLRGLARAIATKRDAVGFAAFTQHQVVAEAGRGDAAGCVVGGFEAGLRWQVNAPTRGTGFLAGAEIGRAHV